MIDTFMANILQLLSLPLEVLGITLALIEIRFRKVADYLRGRILGAQDSVEQPIGFLNILKRTFGVHPDRVRELQIVVLIFLMSIGISTFPHDAVAQIVNMILETSKVNEGEDW